MGKKPTWRAPVAPRLIRSLGLKEPHVVQLPDTGTRVDVERDTSRTPRVLTPEHVHFTNKPLTIALINHYAADESRATVISVFSMVSTLVGGIYLISAKALLAVFSYSQLVLLYLVVTLLMAGKAFWQIIGAR